MRQNRATRNTADSNSTQRKRLLAGMLAAINADGYTGVTVASVIARAGVSRPTFYDYFTDKEDCFLALYRDISRQLLDQIDHAVNDSRPELALHVVVRQLTKYAENEPAHAQILASDALAAGPQALDEREQTINQIGNTVQMARTSASPHAPSPDLPTQVVMGATQWLISQHIRRGERKLAQLAQELTHWLTHYEHPISKHQWSTLNGGPLPELSPQHPELPRSAVIADTLEGISPLPSELAQSRPWRILCATAESAVRSGYAASTVTAITALARLRKPYFYEHFRDKRQAFLAVHELAFQQSMAVGACAYFSEEEWPERVWRCLLATSQFHAAHPAIAHVGLVETHGLGLPAIQRVEDSRRAFTTLLRADGQNRNPPPHATAAEAAGAAIFEIAHDRVRQQRAEDLPGYAYHATYLCLAPFLGVQAANRFVDQKLKDEEGRLQSRKRRRRS